MIKIVAKDLPDQIVIPTMFPDGTSQVWKLELDQYWNKSVKVVWNFEQESELIWVHQLYDLLLTYNINVAELYIPYLPYARQDKEISNTTTFAKATFVSLLPFNIVTTLDSHSKAHGQSIESYSAAPYINLAIMESNADVLVFPDKGAYSRYAFGYQNLKDIITLDKVRDQLTGKILGLTIDESLTTIKNSEESHKFLIVDDLSDFAGTFKHAAKYLHENYQCDIGLYVTHFLGHGGLDHIIEAGITKVYTSNSLDEYRNNKLKPLWNFDDLVIF